MAYGINVTIRIQLEGEGSLEERNSHHKNYKKDQRRPKKGSGTGAHEIMGMLKIKN